MKIRPIILCGGSGTRLWPESKKKEAKQFIDFGGWTLLEKTLDRTQDKIFDYPVISTNFKYLKKVKTLLKKAKINRYKIILEPNKSNTAPAILSSALLNEIPNEQPLVYFPADHILEKKHIFINKLLKNKKKLTSKNIFIFGIKPNNPSTEYGYFLTEKQKGKIEKVKKFIEKPKKNRATEIIKKGGYWNSGIFFFRKDSIVSNFKNFQPKLYKYCLESLKKAKLKRNICFLDKKSFNKVPAISFDYAILEKSKNINGVKLNLPWSDLGSWKEISKLYKKNIKKYFSKKNVYRRPWGKYVNLFEGKNFLIKELTINPKSSISLQKHHHRSEHWMVTKGKPKITINNKKFYKTINESVFIPTGAIHRIENNFSESVKIIEVQTGSILKETDIVRYKDIYNRI